RSVADLIIPRQGHQIYFLRKFDKLMIVGGGLLEFGPDTWEMYDPNQLLPIYYESFPINQFIVDNNVQLQNENIFVSGGWEFLYNPMPVFWASSRSWIFDITSNITQNNNDQKYFSLNQNYPNPFNSSTNIRFTIPEKTLVTIKVFDILGNEIAELLNAEKDAGTYTIKFNADNLSSGLYLYQMKAGGYSFMGKMTLLK
ncbi:MAG: T9SS type A sorting domain-containing protein, partial [Ignavibacterium sp.]